jgi:AcrR family transcriptional regulator
MTDAATGDARWRRRKAARPSEILAAALRSFAERGFAATRLDDVARRAGVTKGTLYLYFPNKAELFKAVVNQAVLPNLERGEALLAAAELPAIRLLEELMRGWAETACSPAGAIPKIMVAEAGNFPELARFYREEVVDRGMALFRRVLQLGVERGEFRALPDLEEVARCIVAPLLLAMLWRHSFGRHEGASRFDPEAICRIELRLLLDGLTLAPAAPGGAAAEQPSDNTEPDPRCVRAAALAERKQQTRVEWATP